MLSYIARRILLSVPVVLLASFLLFWFTRATFDPTARLRASHDPGAVLRERAKLHLDQPIIVQYGRWLGSFVRGDWGKSERTHESVRNMITAAMGNTLQLIFWGVVISGFIAVAIGVYSAVRQYSVLDYTFTGLSFGALAMPPFWFGLIAIELLAVYPQQKFHLGDPPLFFVGLHSVGSSGINLNYFRHLALPVLTLTVQIVASWSRFQRASMLDAMSADYIRTARAKGVPRSKVLLKHGLRNALGPLTTVMAVDIGLLFGGLIITEQIFAIPGMGRLFINALQTGDTQVLSAWLVVTALFVVLFNLLADVLLAVLDPRVRLT